VKRATPHGGKKEIGKRKGGYLKTKGGKGEGYGRQYPAEKKWGK